MMMMMMLVLSVAVSAVERSLLSDVTLSTHLTALTDDVNCTGRGWSD